MKKLRIVFLFWIAFITSCSPTEKQIGTAIAQTMAAWTSTITPTITQTNTPTNTLLPSSTFTQTNSKTSTPKPIIIERPIAWSMIPPQWGSDILLNAKIIEKSINFEYVSDEDQGYSLDATTLVDGNPNTAWSTSSGRFPHWIIFRLSTEIEVNRIGFINHYTGHLGDEGNNYTKDIDVYFASADTNNEYLLLAELQLVGGKGNPPPQNSKLQTFTFNPILIQYIKVVIKSSYFEQFLTKYPRLLDSLGASLAEIALFNSK